MQSHGRVEELTQSGFRGLIIDGIPGLFEWLSNMKQFRICDLKRIPRVRMLLHKHHLLAIDIVVISENQHVSQGIILVFGT